MVDKDVNSEMLLLARKSRGLTQEELVERTRISQGHLSKYEIGEHKVPREQLEKIADALGYPKSFFFQAAEIRGLGASVLYYRKKHRLGQKKLQQIEAMVNVLSLQLRQLLSKCEISGDSEFSQYDIEEYNYDAGKIAQRVRAQWRLPMGPVKSVIGAIEKACGVVMKLDFATRDFDGVGLPVQGLGPFFFMNKELSTDRLRFTLAHEIGHVVMHKSKLTADMEREANEFAAELLMPKDEIYEELRPFSLERAARLKLEWKVSIAALGRRARDLDVVSESQYKRFWARLSALGYRMKEPIALPEEKPSVPARLVEVLQRELKYSYEEMAALAHCKLGEFLVNYLGRGPLNVVGLSPQ